MKKLFFIPALLVAQQAISQYYYKDIVSPKQSAAQMQTWKQQGVKSFKVTSFEANGTPSKDLEVSTNISKDFLVSRTYTSSSSVKSLLTVTYNEKGNLVRSTDSSRSYLSVNEFEYDADGKLTAITNSTNNYDNDFNTSEKHEWHYTNNCPSYMYCIKFGNDTTFINLVCDKDGRPIEEQQVRQKRVQEKFYYYYDDAGRLTDIVRFNRQSNKLLPDVMFNYDENGRLTSMVNVEDDSIDYQNWKYEYNAAGLRTKEICYGRKNDLVGHIEYQYQLK